LAAIAEIVGAAAIVVTIIYLAVQVKHSRESLDANTKAIRGQAISDVTSNIANHMAMRRTLPIIWRWSLRGTM
jgi:hypothetical protein